MFERFTEPARRLIFFARYEAARLGASSIDTEHLLLGLLREEEGGGFKLLGSPGPSAAALRAEVEGSVARVAPMSASVDIPLSTSARRVLELALEEGSVPGPRVVESVHILVALVRESEGAAGRML